MKRTLIVLVVLIPLAGGLALLAETRKTQQAKPNDVSAFMRLKLEHSQKILEGVALEDFPQIKQHAQKLAWLTLDENWQVLQTPEYRDHSRDFQQIANRLSKAADEKNLDGAALWYVQLTLNCVNCHKHVRDQADDQQ